MTRRCILSVLCGAPAVLASTAKLNGVLETSRGSFLLMDASTGQWLASNGAPSIDSAAFPPGSAVKPFVLTSLITAGKLRGDESFYCPERLEIEGRRMDCSHPRLGTAMRVDTAIAYSCNCFVAHMAERFAPGELAMGLRSWGFGAVGTIRDQRLQALGETGIEVSPVEMANAYRRLVRKSGIEPILAGLEGTVDYGTGQLACVHWAKVAGKTGSARRGNEFIAWFCGYAPSRKPEVVVTVMLAGKHGSSDAAPVAHDVLTAWKAGRV